MAFRNDLTEIEVRLRKMNTSNHLDGTYGFSAEFDIYVSRECVGQVAVTLPELDERLARVDVLGRNLGRLGTVLRSELQSLGASLADERPSGSSGT